MKRFLVVFAALTFITTVAIRCGGDSNNAADPSSAANQDATGSVTTGDEATEVMNNAIQSSQQSNCANIAQGGNFAVEGLTKPALRTVLNALKKDLTVPLKIRMQLPEDYEDDFDVEAFQECITGDQTGDEIDATIDVGCILAALPDSGGCTGSGTIRYAGMADGSQFEMTFDNFSIICPADDMDLTCNGSLLAETVGGVFWVCVDMTCTDNGLTESANGCVSDQGDFVIFDEDGDAVIVSSIGITNNCAQATATIETVDGTITVTCDVSSADTPCESIADVKEVENCEIN